MSPPAYQSLQQEKRRRSADNLRQISQAENPLFINPDPVAWIEEHFHIPETRGIIPLEPYQKAMLRKALSRDENGLFNYSTIIWSDVKKSAKSTIAAAIALWMAFQVEWGQITLVANDLKQVDSRVGFYIRRAIELNPALADVCKIIRYQISLPNHTIIESVPIDPSGEAGGNADMVVFSELWGAHQEAKKRMWAEMTLPPAKFGKSFRWVETYAGYSGESLLLENLYQQGTKKDQGAYRLQVDGVDEDFPVFANDQIRMWNDRGRMPWHTPEYYGQEEGVLIPNEFRRLHGNEWVSSVDVFVEKAWWNACQKDIPPSQDNDPWIVALDAGVSGDNFAVVAVSRLPGEETHSAVRYAKRWLPPKGGKIDFQGTKEDPGPEMELRRLIEAHNVIQIAYDPYQLEDMAGRLRKEGLGWFKAFSQAKDRLIADSQLRLMIMECRVHHSGEHDLKEHVGNANAKIDPEERKIRIVKRSELLKVDLAVALSMANGECMRLNL